VTIDNGGRQELLYLDQADAPGAQDGAGTAPPTAAPAPALSIAPAPGSATPPALPITPSSIRAGISFTPHQDGGRMTGITVGQLGDGTAFQAAGFRAGDVVRSVNGRAVASPADVAALSAQLQPGARLSLEVDRGGTTVPLALTLPNGRP